MTLSQVPTSTSLCFARSSTCSMSRFATTGEAETGWLCVRRRVAVFTRYSSTLRRWSAAACCVSCASVKVPAQKADFAAGSALREVAQQHQRRRNGARHVLVKAQKAVETKAGVRGARALTSASDIIASCIQARITTSQAAFKHLTTAPPTL